MEGYGYSADEYCVPEPYPPVQAVGKNRRSAEAMLDNVGGSNSEMSAVAVYVLSLIHISWGCTPITCSTPPVPAARWPDFRLPARFWVLIRRSSP